MRNNNIFRTGSFVIIFCFFLCLGVQAEEKTKLTIGYLPVIDQLPIVVAHENGHLNYKKCSVVLDKYLSWTALEAAFRLQVIDGCLMTVPISLTLASENIPLKILGIVSRGGMRLIVKEGTNVTDLQDKIIGVPGIDSMENIILYDFLKKNDMLLGQDVRSMNIFFNKSINDLQEGLIDGFFLPEPYSSIAEKENVGIELEAAENLSKGKLSTVLIIQEEIYMKYPEAVGEWLESVERAVKEIEDDIEQTKGKQSAIIQKKYMDLDIVNVEEVLQGSQSYLSFVFRKSTREELLEINDVASEMKLLNSSVPLDKVLLR